MGSEIYEGARTCSEVTTDHAEFMVGISLVVGLPSESAVVSTY